jgi:hypothetical protein
MAIIKVIVNSVVHIASAPRSASASGKSGASNERVVLVLKSPDPNRQDDTSNCCFATFLDWAGKIGAASQIFSPPLSPRSQLEKRFSASFALAFEP